MIAALAVAVLTASFCISCAQDPPDVRDTPAIMEKVPSEISVAHLRSRTVLGDLGVPLGQVVEIEATVIDGNSLRRKAYQGELLLQVDKVDGKARELPQPLKWYDRSGKLPLKPAPGDDKLVGSRQLLLAYEVGQFRGVPDRRGYDFMMWADVGYGYEASLVILQKLESPNR